MSARLCLRLATRVLLESLDCACNVAHGMRLCELAGAQELAIGGHHGAGTCSVRLALMFRLRLPLRLQVCEQPGHAIGELTRP